MPEIISLTTAKSRADILVSQGLNCYSFQVDGHDVIWAEDNHSSGECRPSGGGIPLLYPFPGRIGGGKLLWEGKQYELEAGDGRGNAIHGFAYDRPWRVVSQDDSSVVAEFTASLDAPETLQRWPSDFSIVATYQLSEQQLRCDVQVKNCGHVPMPSGFGAHPYFCLPAGEESVVRLPATDQWELQDMLPTGVCEPLPDAPTVHHGQPMKRLTLDNVFGGLLEDNGCFTASIAGEGRTMELRFGRPFRELVVYTPGHRKAICIEPYSCVPAAVTLGEMAGWSPMAPAATQKYWFEIELR